MAKGQLEKVLTHLRGMLVPRGDAGPSDGQLLERFTRLREETSFAALVQRHAGLVLGVCRRLLGDIQDAEDAFQATFLVLAQKAASIRNREAVGSWLYGVAYRIAARARAAAQRRRTLEQQAVPLAGEEPVAEIVWRELRQLLDEELQRLPEKYRAPVVLCYLENKSQGEVARELGWTRGTLSGRLARARDILRRRLTRRGLTLSGGLLPIALAEKATAAVPAALAGSTVKAACLASAAQAAVVGFTSLSVTALVEGALQAMWITKLKIATAVLLAFAVVGSGTAWFAHRVGAEEPQTAGNANPRQKTPGPMATFKAVDKLKEDDELSRLKKENDELKKTIKLLKRQLDELKQKIDGQAAKEKPQPVKKGPPAKALSPDGRMQVIGQGKALTMTDVQTGKIFWQAVGHKGQITAVAFSPDGKTVVSGSTDQAIRMWDAQTGKEIRRLLGQQGAIRSLTFTGDGKNLISQGVDKSTLIWDVATGKLVSKVEGKK
jgi:RNA polymerase sigma factor (sigma-70 family)